MNNGIKSASILVLLLTILAVGADSLSPSHQRSNLATVGGVLAVEGGVENVSPPVIPTEDVQQKEIEKMCEEKKKEAAESGQWQSANLTQPFEKENVTEKNRCVGAIFDPASFAAKSTPTGTDPKKNPEAYKCVGEVTKVTITEGGTGSISSHPDTSGALPKGTCLTTYCDSSGVCTRAKAFSIEEVLHSLKIDPEMISNGTFEHLAGITPLPPLDEDQQKILDELIMPPIPSSEPPPVQTTDSPRVTPNMKDGSVGTIRPPSDEAEHEKLPVPPIPPLGGDPGASSKFRSVNGAEGQPPINVDDVSKIPSSPNAIQTNPATGPVLGLQGTMVESARIHPYEFSYVVVVDPDGKVIHSEGRIGTPTGVHLPASEELSKAEAQPGAKMYEMHTHPLETILPNKAERDAVLRGDQPYPTMPPSGLDNERSFMRCILNSSNYVSQTVDPSGVWSMTLNEDSPEYQTFKRDALEIGKQLDIVNNPDSLDAAGKKLIEKNAGLAALKRHESNYNDPYKYNNPVNRQELIDLYKGAGMTLTYTPFPSGIPRK